MNVELRRLETDDLAEVEEIERESYPTPWSRAMFGAELRKPSSLALGAYSAEGELVGFRSSAPNMARDHGVGYDARSISSTASRSCGSIRRSSIFTSA